MATLYFLDKFCKSNRHMFTKAMTAPEILIGSVSKIYIEHKMLCFETSVYVFGVNSIVLPMLSDPMLSIWIGSNIVIVPVCIGACYVVPAYRTYNSYTNNKLKIFNLKQTE